MYNLELHHRVFKSETQSWLDKHLEISLRLLKETRGITIKPWKLDDIQNLVLLCRDCHTGRIHNWDSELRKKYRNSYTCPETWFNIPFYGINEELY